MEELGFRLEIVLVCGRYLVKCFIIMFGFRVSLLGVVFLIDVIYRGELYLARLEF